MNLSEINKHSDLYWLESQKAVTEKNHKKVFIIARPILIFLSKFFIIPKKIRLILANVVEVMDLIYPEEAQSPLSTEV
jgi:hypothetical protein